MNGASIVDYLVVGTILLAAGIFIWRQFRNTYRGKATVCGGECAGCRSEAGDKTQFERKDSND